TAGYYAAASVAVTGLGGTDTGSGVDLTTGVLERASATLSAGNCGTFGAFTQVATGGSSYTDTSVASGNCYEYRYKIGDNVGNVSAYSPTSNVAKVDTSAPTVANAAPTAGTNPSAQYWDAASSTLWFRPAAGGSFTLN